MKDFTLRSSFCWLGLLVMALSCSWMASKMKVGDGPLPNVDGEQSLDFAFVYHDEVESGLFKSTIDDRVAVKLTQPPEGWVDVSPVWSPDLDRATEGYQGRIAFVHRRRESVEDCLLQTIDSNGFGLRTVASFSFQQGPIPRDHSNSFGDNTLAWSPSGREIIFADTVRLWSVDVSTGDLHCLLESYVGIGDVSLSDAKQHIAMYMNGDVAIVNFQVDSGGILQIDPDSFTNVTDDGYFVMDNFPAMSPDGVWLAYRRAERLIVYRIETGDEQTVISSGCCGEPTWSPDSTQIAVCWHAENEAPEITPAILRVVNVWNSHLRQSCLVTTSPAGQRTKVHPDWNPGWRSSLKKTNRFRRA